jgi:tetratricopeptide (TPR) repeat protein
MVLRCVLCALALIAQAAPALAASEADRRACASEQNADTRIAACTRVLDDPATVPLVRAMAHRNRGYGYGSKGLRDLAIADFDEVLKLNPQDLNALGGRGRAYLQKGQYDRSIADFSELLRLSPRSDRALNERGLAHLRKGDLESALADFASALKINPAMVHALNNRGLVYARLGQLDLAIADYDEALRLEPRYLLAYVNRGRAHEAKGEFELAVADFKQAAEGVVRPNSEDDRRAHAGAKQQLARLTAAIAEGKVGAKVLSERRVALVIGNSAYEHVPALRNPANDAKALAELLRRLGFAEVREVYNANLMQLGKALKDFGDLAAGADWAVIYYAGHGIAVEGVNYLIPVDAALEQQAHVEDEALPLPRLLSKVGGASKMQLVILDACRNNPFIPKMRQAGRQVRSISKGLVSIEPDAGALVAFSARDGTTALDGDSENSPYAAALLKFLPEPNLEISIFFRKVRDEVLASTHRQQEPFTYGSPPAQPFYFKR